MKAPTVDLDEILAGVPPLLTAPRAAELLAVDGRTLRRWIASGRIAVLKMSRSRAGRILVPRAEIRRVLEEWIR